jgi:hypothetical protein
MRNIYLGGGGGTKWKILKMVVGCPDRKIQICKPRVRYDDNVKVNAING